MNEIAKNTVFELTKAVYRVTALFSPNEVLKNQIRQKANDILSLISVYQNHFNDFKDNPAEQKRLVYNITSSITVINVYFQLAKIYELAHPLNFDVLESEYLKLSDVFRNVAAQNNGKIEENSFLNSEIKLTDRQLKLLNYLKEKNQAQISDLSALLNNQLSEKTIRRDLQKMIDYGLIRQIGEKRWTAYFLNENNSQEI